MLYNLLLQYEPLLAAVRQEWLDHFLSLEFDEKKARKLVHYFVKEIDSDVTGEEVRVVFVDGPNEAKKLLDDRPSITRHRIDLDDLHSRLFMTAKDQLANCLTEVIFTQHKKTVLQQFANLVDRYFSLEPNLCQSLDADEVSFAKDEIAARLLADSNVVIEIFNQVKLMCRHLSQHAPFFPFWNFFPFPLISSRVLNPGGRHILPFWQYGTFTDFEWVSLYDGLQRAGLVEVEDLSYYMSLVKANIFFWIPSYETSIVCKPPELIKFDDRNRLHSVDGYAIKFRDGYGRFYVHGVNFDRGTFDQFFTGRYFSPRDILQLPNIHRRITLIQHFGIDAVFDHIGEKRLINRDECVSAVTRKRVVCELYDCELPDLEPVRLLKLEDHTTHKPVVLAVPLDDDTNTCRKAIAWTFGMTGEEYKLDFES
jgi:hypothetical protein